MSWVEFFRKINLAGRTSIREMRVPLYVVIFQCTEMLKLSQDIAVIHLERCVIGHDLPPLDTVS